MMDFGVAVGCTHNHTKYSAPPLKHNLSSKDLISTRYETTDANRDCPGRAS
jgi:hypothetical protein